MPEACAVRNSKLAWCDELSKWKDADACFDMLQFGLRLGSQPRQLITTTPKPTPLVKRLYGDAGGESRSDGDRRKCANLAEISRHDPGRYGRSRLGRQELDARMIEDRDDALWSRA